MAVPKHQKKSACRHFQARPRLQLRWISWRGAGEDGFFPQGAPREIPGEPQGKLFFTQRAPQGSPRGGPRRGPPLGLFTGLPRWIGVETATNGVIDSIAQFGGITCRSHSIYRESCHAFLYDDAQGQCNPLNRVPREAPRGASCCYSRPMGSQQAVTGPPTPRWSK